MSDLDPVSSVFDLDEYITTKASKKHKKNRKIGVIVQARMTSKRFPRKSTAKLLGIPVIAHVFDKVKSIDNVSNVIVAVPDTPESEPILQIADGMGIANFCGSENDVLTRYYEAAKFFNLDVIMRITGDCPLLDVNVCNKVLGLFLWRSPDYCSNIYPVRTYPKGLDCEVFSFDALEAANIICTEASDREHVTPYMQREDAIIKAQIRQREDRSFINYCVDYPEDIQRLEIIMNGKASKPKLLIGV
jgi:spore coat polysaccharide biosynthesis protein SpsF (cytidylyltransferase family)